MAKSFPEAVRPYRTETTSAMPPAATARLLLPRPALAACVFMGVERDTRGMVLSDVSPGRLNGLMATHEAFWFYRLLGEWYG